VQDLRTGRRWIEEQYVDEKEPRIVKEYPPDGQKPELIDPEDFNRRFKILYEAWQQGGKTALGKALQELNKPKEKGD
jgi:hypothetical protein